MIDKIGQYLPTLITAGIALATFLEAKRGKKTQQIVDEAIKPLIKGRDENRKNIEDLTEEVRLVRLDTTRIQLLNLIRSDPHNHDTILMVAERYFLTLRGDWIASSEFLSWAEREDIKVPSAILRAIDDNHSKNQNKK